MMQKLRPLSMTVVGKLELLGAEVKHQRFLRSEKVAKGAVRILLTLHTMCSAQLRREMEQNSRM